MWTSISYEQENSRYETLDSRMRDKISYFSRGSQRSDAHKAPSNWLASAPNYRSGANAGNNENVPNRVLGPCVILGSVLTQETQPQNNSIFRQKSPIWYSTHELEDSQFGFHSEIRQKSTEFSIVILACLHDEMGNCLKVSLLEEILATCRTNLMLQIVNTDFGKGDPPSMQLVE